MSFRDLFFPPSRITCQSFIRVLLGRSNSLASLIFEVFTPIGMPKWNIKILGDWNKTKFTSDVFLCRTNDKCKRNVEKKLNRKPIHHWPLRWIHVLLLKIQTCLSLVLNWFRQRLLITFYANGVDRDFNRIISIPSLGYNWNILCLWDALE